MYGKLFKCMYDGTLYGQWQAIVTLQQLIVLADPDGVVDMTPPAVAAKTSIPLEIIEEGLSALMQPDKYSRTPDEDGRRIVLLDDHRPWGWQIVNYQKYRALRDQDEVREGNRERQRRKREKDALSRDVTDCHSPSRDVTCGHAKSRQEEEEAEEEEDKTPHTPRGGDRFEEFWKAYPKRVGKAAAKRVWSRKGLNAKADEIIPHLQARARSDVQWLADDGKYVPNPATWLNRDGWDDEYKTKPVEHEVYI